MFRLTSLSGAVERTVLREARSVAPWLCLGGPGVRGRRTTGADAARRDAGGERPSDRPGLVSPESCGAMAARRVSRRTSR